MKGSLLVMISICVAACGGDATTLEPPPLPGEKVGRPISPEELPHHDIGNPGVVWSVDGREVFYVPHLLTDGLPPSIRAADVSGSGVRTVTSGMATYVSIRMSSDGALFFSARVVLDSAMSVFRLRPGAASPERVVTHVAAGFAVSDDGSRVAYVWRDTLRVQDVQTGADVLALARHDQPLSIGAVGLAHLPWGGLPEMTTFADAAGRTLLDPLDPVFSGELAISLGDVRWTEAGLDVLSRGRGLYITSAATGATRRLWGPATQLDVGVRHAVWSPDGRSVAAWVTPTCWGSSPCLSTLHLVDVATGSSMLIGHTTTEHVNRPAFSRDGRQLALPHGRLYVLDPHAQLTP